MLLWLSFPLAMQSQLNVCTRNSEQLQHLEELQQLNMGDEQQHAGAVQKWLENKGHWAQNH